MAILGTVQRNHLREPFNSRFPAARNLPEGSLYFKIVARWIPALPVASIIYYRRINELTTAQKSPRGTERHLASSFRSRSGTRWVERACVCSSRQRFSCHFHIVLIAAISDLEKGLPGTNLGCFPAVERNGGIHPNGDVCGVDERVSIKIRWPPGSEMVPTSREPYPARPMFRRCRYLEGI